MSHCVLWLDPDKADIFYLLPEGIQKTRIKRNTINHHTFNNKDHHGDPNTEHFFKDLAAKLGNTGEILLLGPGLAKNHFKTYLETHFKNGMANKIVGIENTDHPTDNQIIAVARKFFKTYNLFHHPIQVREIV